ALERADVGVNILGLPVAERVLWKVRHACRRRWRRYVRACAKKSDKVLFTGKIRRPVAYKRAPRFTIVAVTSVASVVVIESLPIRCIDADRAGRRVGVSCGGGAPAAPTALGADKHRNDQRNT